LEFYFTLAKSSSVRQAASSVKASPQKRNKTTASNLIANVTEGPNAGGSPAPVVESVPTHQAKPEMATNPKVATAKSSGKKLTSVKKTISQASESASAIESGKKTIVKKAAKKKAATKAEPEKSWYDYPHYYDVGFREDTPREAKFFEKAFAKYIPGKVKRVFEPGCGSGRLVVEMAERGFQVTGLDLNQPALDYCKEQLDKKGLKATLINGDMTAFELKRPADAAFNTINTFRHLLTEEDAVKHLKCVAANLRPGGIYILGLHLLPTGGDFYGSEKWKAKEGRTQINYSLTVVDSLPKQRHEKLRITMTIKKGKSVVRVSDHFTLRLYNYKNIKTLFAQVPELVLRDVYDFWYEIDEPQKLDGNIADSVFILQKPE
jgi:SAM-dependent methyltransferase